MLKARLCRGEIRRVSPRLQLLVKSVRYCTSSPVRTHKSAAQERPTPSSPPLPPTRLKPAHAKPGAPIGSGRASGMEAVGSDAELADEAASARCKRKRAPASPPIVVLVSDRSCEFRVAPSFATERLREICGHHDVLPDGIYGLARVGWRVVSGRVIDAIAHDLACCAGVQRRKQGGTTVLEYFIEELECFTPLNYSARNVAQVRRM